MRKRVFFIPALMMIAALCFYSCTTGTKKDEGETEAKAEQQEGVKESKQDDKVKIDESLLAGSWIDQSPAELHFTINADGTAKSDNMATLLYQKWKLDGDKITFTVKSIGNQISSVDEETYIIVKLDRHEMVLKDEGGQLHHYKRNSPTVNITPGQKITSPLTVIVNSEGVWMAHEGEVGMVEIVDEQGNRLSKATGNDGPQGILISVDGNWMSDKPAEFRATISFDPKGAKKGRVIIRSNAGPGDGNEGGATTHTIEIPVTF